LLLSLDLEEHSPAHEQEARGGVKDLNESPAFSHRDRALAGQELARPLFFDLLGIEAADDGQSMGSQPMHGRGLERDVRVDPHQFLEPVGERLGREPVARDIDLGEPVEAPDGVSLGLQLPERELAMRLDVASGRDEDHAP